HPFAGAAHDGAGNTEPSPPGAVWLVDTSAPDTSITVSPAGTTSDPNAAFNYAGDDAGGSGVASFECSLDAAAFASCPDTGVTYPGLPDGSHTFAVRATDQAGNTDSSPSTFSC